MAEIEPLPGINWSAHAALHDSISRIEDPETPMISMWIDPDGRIRHSTNATRMQIVWMLEVVKDMIVGGKD